MKKRKHFSIISIFLAGIILFTYYYPGQAAATDIKYNEPISVAFTSMGSSLSSIDNITITDDYLLKNNSQILKKDKVYKVTLSNSFFTVYENGKAIYSTDKDIVFEPLNSGSFIKFKKPIPTDRVGNYLGTMTFKKKNSSYFTPINNLDIDEYLKGVLPYEIYESWGNKGGMDALKAQAVTARTFALYRKNGHRNSESAALDADVTDTTSSQVYGGYDPTCKNSIAAVESTRGQVLTYNNNLIDATFSDSNGGYTERAENVWSGGYPYLLDLPDPFDRDHMGWVKKLSEAQILSILQSNSTIKASHPDVKEFLNIDIDSMQFYPSGRIKYMAINYKDSKGASKTITVSKQFARTLFGLDSALYKVKKEGTTYTFTGNGWGHGVGLSQDGAYGRSKAGHKYESILSFYYQGTKLTRIYANNPIVGSVIRIGGDNRYSTSRLIAEKTYSGIVNNVVIATGIDFPDALSGAPLAKKVNGPILLVDKDPNSPNSKTTIDFIINNMDKNGTIYILGEKGIIPQTFESKFNGLGYKNIVRLGGSDRIKTSLSIAKNMNIDKNCPVVIATKYNFADALSISPISAKNGWPILLTDTDKMDSSVEEYINNIQPSKVYIAGGTGVVSDNVKNRLKTILNCGEDRFVRLGGSDRYATSRIINANFNKSPKTITVATGAYFPDALSGSISAAQSDGVILLVERNKTSEAINYLKLVGSSGKVDMVVLGLQGAVEDYVVNLLKGVTN